MTTLLAQAAPVTPVGQAAEFWVFVVVGSVALGSAIAMVMLRNAVHGALMLVVNFFALAVLYAVLEAQFLAVIQIIVYAGAIMVLFLFVIMLLGVAREEPVHGRFRGQKPVAVLLGALLFVGIVASGAAPFIGEGSVCGADVELAARGQPCAGLAAVNAEGNVRAVAEPLFTDYVWPFEVMSVLLVIAAIGAIVIGKRHERPDELVDPVPAAAPPDPAGASEPARDASEPTRDDATDAIDEEIER